jgi:enoyl-[acyl-carrier-protein] reductase (NADH)
MNIRHITCLFIQFRNKILNHESIFHVIGFSDGSNTHDAMGRISRSWAAFDVATTASSWILAAAASKVRVSGTRRLQARFLAPLPHRRTRDTGHH